MRKYTLAYEDRDVINNPSIYAESLSPCVEVNGHMLADVSGDEVEAYLLKAGVVQPTAASADQPGLRRASP
jgi:monothiol glutaredoxin